MQQLSIVVFISVLAWTFLRSVRPLGPPLIESKNKPQLRMALTGFFERMGKCMAKAVSGEKEDGTNVISAKNIAALRNDVAKAESKLISYLKDRNVSRLPERQTPEPELDDKEHKAEQKSSNPRSAVGAIEVMQPIKADRAGNIKVTIKQFALDLGLHQGCHVQDGVGDKMKEGVVQLVHDDYVQIQFEKGDKKYHAESAIEKLTIVAQEKKRKVDAPALMMTLVIFGSWNLECNRRTIRTKTEQLSRARIRILPSFGPQTAQHLLQIGHASCRPL